MSFRFIRSRLQNSVRASQVQRFAHTEVPIVAKYTKHITALSLIAGAVGYSAFHASKPVETFSLPLPIRPTPPPKAQDFSMSAILEPDFPLDIDLNDASIPTRVRMIAHLRNLQQNICDALQDLESTSPNPGKTSPKFETSFYYRTKPDGEKGGYGDTRVIQDGNTFEKGGCALSVINSTLSPAAIRQMRAERFDWWDGKSELPYFVTGCSLVVHPENPHAPTIHFNYRYFEILDPQNPNGEPKTWWFGGGTDLTPSYLYDDDARDFHKLYKNACDRADNSYYPKFKKWCDEYFTNTHRGERRGIGGIFFDDLSAKTSEDKEKLFSFVKDCSNQFIDAYVPIVAKRRTTPVTEEEKLWQQIRRGRYVEFNLVHDRGTKFGLAMKEPRTESILMSLPLTARWEYDCQRSPNGSREKRLVDVLQKPVEWV